MEAGRGPMVIVALVYISMSHIACVPRAPDKASAQRQDYLSIIVTDEAKGCGVVSRVVLRASDDSVLYAAPTDSDGGLMVHLDTYMAGALERLEVTRGEQTAGYDCGAILEAAPGADVYFVRLPQCAQRGAYAGAVPREARGALGLSTVQVEFSDGGTVPSRVRLRGQDGSVLWTGTSDSEGVVRVALAGRSLGEVERIEATMGPNTTGYMLGGITEFYPNNGSSVVRLPLPYVPRFGQSDGRNIAVIE